MGRDEVLENTLPFKPPKVVMTARSLVVALQTTPLSQQSRLARSAPP